MKRNTENEQAICIMDLQEENDHLKQRLRNAVYIKHFITEDGQKAYSVPATEDKK